MLRLQAVLMRYLFHHSLKCCVWNLASLIQEKDEAIRQKRVRQQKLLCLVNMVEVEGKSCVILKS